jgi:hypothetical protein
MGADLLALVASRPDQTPLRASFEEMRRRALESARAAAQDAGAGVGSRAGAAVLEVHP